jgi:pyruvate,water dikinase
VTVASLDGTLDADLYGGKAAQLATAVRAGLPVPHGVALSVDLVEALERAWALVQAPLAVRSSAVGEDSEAASFAGQHATYLNVRSPTELESAVRAVRDSAHSESALAYRRRLGLDEAPRIAVVVQELIEAECAGVLFTQNPLDGADELLIEAAWGLGESVVNGLVTPDRFRIARDGTVLERAAGVKDVAVAPVPEGGTRELQVPDERVRPLCLDDARLSELTGLARRCEDAFAGSRDLEWALAGGQLYLLQCRAVTRAASVSL